MASRNDRLLKRQQLRLLQLFHASNCRLGKSCKEESCSQMTFLWNHISSCKDDGCNVKSCISSRYVLSHYRQCNPKKNDRCLVCAPLRAQILQHAKLGLEESEDQFTNKAWSHQKVAAAAPPHDQVQAGGAEASADYNSTEAPAYSKHAIDPSGHIVPTDLRHQAGQSTTTFDSSQHLDIIEHMEACFHQKLLARNGDGKIQTILFIDDMATEARMFEKIMSSSTKHCNIQVTLARSAGQGLKITKGKVFDIILVDVRMPTMSGVDFATLFRAREAEIGGAAVKAIIVAVTSYESEAWWFKCAEMGIDVVLSKTQFQSLLQNDRSAPSAPTLTAASTAVAAEVRAKPGVRSVQLEKCQASDLIDILEACFTRELSQRHPSAKIRRLLIIDDQDIQLLMFRKIISNSRHSSIEVSTASSAKEALELTQHEAFDLILVDIMMPEFNGVDFAMAYRQREVATVEGGRLTVFPTLIVAVTSLQKETWWDDCAKMGMNAIVSKRHFQTLCEPRSVRDMDVVKRPHGEGGPYLRHHGEPGEHELERRRPSNK